MSSDSSTATDTTESSRSAEPPVAELTYEQARDELVRLVARIEAGSTPLEESMRLWQRGEELAAHCTAWLDRAQAGLDGRPAAGDVQPDAEQDVADDDDGPTDVEDADSSAPGQGEHADEDATAFQDDEDDVDIEDDDEDEDETRDDAGGSSAPVRER